MEPEHALKFSSLKRLTRQGLFHHVLHPPTQNLKKLGAAWAFKKVVAGTTPSR